MYEQKQLTIFSFFGPPGAGKGTLAERCRKELGFETLSTGDLCRKHVMLNTELGKKVAAQMKEGTLVADEYIIAMVKGYLLEKTDFSKPIILDGFPRTARQAQLFVEVLRHNNITLKFRVVRFDIPHDDIIKRLSNRLVCLDKDCQAIYSRISLPPQREGICDKCNSMLGQRSDDAIDVIRERLAIYPTYEQELLTFYNSINQPVDVLTINAKSAVKVFELFETLLKHSFSQPDVA